MSTVYVLRQPNPARDIKSAEDFGEMKICLKLSEMDLAPGMILNRLRSTLKDFDEGDYLLWAGGEWPILVAAGIVLKEMGLTRVDFLVWRKMLRGGSAYTPRRMVL